ncbi:MAG: hypothetical protein NTX72_00865 [Candidatus Uhrbacteria bacterium]|nr:hypothetical protein [Candidatus Uhrbacteria bacterium]
MEDVTTKKIMLAFEKQEETTGQIKTVLEKHEQTTNYIMDILVSMQIQITGITKTMATRDDIEYLDQRINDVNQKISELDRKNYASDKKFESKFDLLFDAIGELKENFTIMDYNFINLRRKVLAS